jgi:tetratricopeptide (TPR) repeat protein
MNRMLRIVRSRWFVALVILGVLGGAAGIWALLHPAAFWLQPWRPDTSMIATRFIFGPYPVEADFEALKKKGVTTIVSLLDSDLPYEKILLGQEIELAQRHGMRVLNFPMASILGRSFGKDYEANSRAAARAALESEGTVYLHCYLGLHRAARVRKILSAEADTAVYVGSVKSERTPEKLARERAGMAFRDGDMEETLRELAKIPDKSVEARVMEGWANYRLSRVETARAAFAAALGRDPENPEAQAGLGYSALRCGDVDAAASTFESLRSRRPDDTVALEGLGLARYRQKRFEEARALYEAALQKNPDSPEGREILERLQPVPVPTLIAIGLILLGFGALAAGGWAATTLRRLVRADAMPRQLSALRIGTLGLALLLGIGSLFMGYGYGVSEVYGIPFPWGGVDLGAPYGGGPTSLLPKAANFAVWFLLPHVALALGLRRYLRRRGLRG